jgi:hypothetical protein
MTTSSTVLEPMALLEAQFFVTAPVDKGEFRWGNPLAVGLRFDFESFSERFHFEQHFGYPSASSLLRRIAQALCQLDCWRRNSTNPVGKRLNQQL